MRVSISKSSLRIRFQISQNQRFRVLDRREMVPLSVFPTLVAFCQIITVAETQTCPATELEESVLGWMLQKHIYRTMRAHIGIPCALVCREDVRCQSLNFVMSLRMCEFSNRTKEARPEDFVPDPDRYYFRRDINRGEWNI